MRMIKQKTRNDCVLACLAMVDNVQLDTLHRQVREICGSPWYENLTHEQRNHQTDLLSQARYPWLSDLIKITRNPCKISDFRKSPGNLRRRGIISVVFYHFLFGPAGHAIAFENGVIYEPTKGEVWLSFKKYKKAIEKLGSVEIFVAGVVKKPRYPVVAR